MVEHQRYRFRLFPAQLPTTMKTLVCGGRDYVNRSKIFEELDSIHTDRPITELIHGAASGADTISGEWALLRGIPVRRFPARWNVHGKAAGYIRNRQMLVEGKPNLVVAFPGGKGTAMMIQLAKGAGVEVIEF